MKNFFLLCLLFLFSVVSFGQDCGDCSKPSVAMYDFQINVARPTEDAAILKYFELFWVARSAVANVRDNEPSADCMYWIDGAMVNANELQGGTLKFGMEYTNLAPTGTYNTADYILYGSVSGTEGNYTAEMYLEAGYSRELVKSVSVSFDNVTVSGYNAGVALASSFGSILQTIRDFEVKKRDEDTEVAIRDLLKSGVFNEVLVEPEQTNVTVGDQVTVKITLIDCDGVPLANRKLYLKAGAVGIVDFGGSTNGHFLSDEVTTNAEGIAEAEFVVDNPGTATAVVNFPHFKPVGRPNLFQGTALLNAEEETVELSGTYNYRLDCTGDTSWVVSDENASITFKSSTRMNEGASFSFKAVLGKNYAIPILKIFDRLLSVQVNGKQYYNEDFHKDFTVHGSGGTYPGINIERLSSSSTPIRSSADFSVRLYNEEIPDIDVFCDFKRDKKYLYKHFNLDQGWQTDEGSYSDTALSIHTGINNNGDNSDKNHIYSNGVHTFKWTVEEKYTDPGTVYDYHGHALNYKSAETWNIICKTEPTTSTQNDPEKLSYYISQNYPNPFNPETTIEYSIPTASRVTIKVYNLLGQETATLVDQNMNRGKHEVKFNASGLSSGMYLYKIQAGSFSAVRKLMLLK